MLLLKVMQLTESIYLMNKESLNFNIASLYKEIVIFNFSFL